MIGDKTSSFAVGQVADEMLSRVQLICFLDSAADLVT